MDEQLINNFNGDLNFIKTDKNPNEQRLAILINKLFSKQLKENYDTKSEPSENFEFPLILKEYTINYKKDE